MRISLNGGPAIVADDVTVGALIDGIGRGRRGVAVAVNDEVVSRSRWDETQLAPGDRVEVLTAAQGG